MHQQECADRQWGKHAGIPEGEIDAPGKFIGLCLGEEQHKNKMPHETDVCARIVIARVLHQNAASKGVVATATSWSVTGWHGWWREGSNEWLHGGEA